MSKSEQKPFSCNIVSLLMWLIPLSFFTYQFVLRLWPSLLMSQIMAQFSIDATAFGILASVYYYGYAFMQIPMAIMIDKYGTRIVLFICAILCGISTLAFSYTENWYIALLSRFLIGVASAAGFLTTSKVISTWFKEESYSRMVGFSFSIGLMGAIYGGKPVSLLIEEYHWQNVAVALCCIAIIIGLFGLIFLRDKSGSNASNKSITFKDLSRVLSSCNIWLIGIANLLMVGSLEGFADIWGVNYLMKAYTLSKADAAEITSFIFIGMLFGGPLLAMLAGRIGNYATIAFAGIVMSLCFIKIVFGSNAINELQIMFFIVGVMCCYQVIIFATGAKLTDPLLLSVGIAFLNCMNMLGGSFFHTAIGYVMDVFYTGETLDGVRQYSVEAYNNALLVIPTSAIIGVILVLFVMARSYKSAK